MRAFELMISVVIVSSVFSAVAMLILSANP